MSDRSRTPEEFIQRYADQYCKGDVEVAKTHAIVKEACKELEQKEERH